VTKYYPRKGENYQAPSSQTIPQKHLDQTDNETETAEINSGGSSNGK